MEVRWAEIRKGAVDVLNGVHEHPGRLMRFSRGLRRQCVRV